MKVFSNSVIPVRFLPWTPNKFFLFVDLEKSILAELLSCPGIGLYAGNYGWVSRWQEVMSLGVSEVSP